MTDRLAVRRAGDRGFLVEVGDNRRVHVLAAAARTEFGGGLEDVVPGEDTLLLTWRVEPPQLADLSARLGAIALDRPSQAGGRQVTIPVRYDGADLDAVAAAAELSVDVVIELHVQAEYTVAFMGFAPGFAYMTGVDPRLQLPRREEPRARVPAGSVAIASTYAAVYPTSAPGGWHLLGHTDATLFDHRREPPALLEPGIRVVFEPE
jgi:KipI family sensor histidine kinase inhibitor